jgi:hypothetical protein
MALGVDVRGRSRKLRVNYRTSHQIRRGMPGCLRAEPSGVAGDEVIPRSGADRGHRRGRVADDQITFEHTGTHADLFGE